MTDFLKNSLAQLNAITRSSYNSDIMPVALSIWEKHLQPDNPQWRHITARPFYIEDDNGSAHVLAMVDARLPDIGIVGYFACTNSEVGARALQQAAEWLKQTHQLTDVYGPINGTLPSDYRLNLRDEFHFPGEPVNPTWHIDAFRGAGFTDFNHYVSGRSKHFKTFMKLSIRTPKKGYRHLTVRPFDATNYNRDFKIYHDLRNAIFPSQSIYCPAISLEERIYHSTGKFDSSYCFFLVDTDIEIGFIMAYPYKNQLILKTICLLPEYRGKRLTGQLLKPVLEQAKQDGLEAAIYAMIRVGNAVYKTRKPGVRSYGRYLTMHKHL